MLWALQTGRGMMAQRGEGYRALPRRERAGARRRLIIDHTQRRAGWIP
jgi:hypothetical protein